MKAGRKNEGGHMLELTLTSVALRIECIGVPAACCIAVWSGSAVITGTAEFIIRVRICSLDGCREQNPHASPPRTCNRQRRTTGPGLRSFFFLF